MSQIRLSYCPVDKGYYVYLLEYETVVREKFFKEEKEAREFIKAITA